MNKKPIFTPVEKYIDPYNVNIWWYYIPGFNGYEISNTGIVRSMKHFRKYPFGILIKPKEVSDLQELFTKQIFNKILTYELSDNNNERQTVKVSKLLELAKNNPYPVSGYPRLTITTDVASRNLRCFIQPKTATSVPLTQQIHQVQFYYEKDNNIKEQDEIIKPIIFERTNKDV